MDETIKYNEWLRVGKGPLATSSFRKDPPRVDPEISKIVGRKVFVNDPNLIKMATKYKARKNPDSPDNFLKNPDFIKEIKQTFQ